MVDVMLPPGTFWLSKEWIVPRNVRLVGFPHDSNQAQADPSRKG
jgi:hypothetical protein